MAKFLISFILIILFVSCGQSDRERIDDAIEKAQTLITLGRCDDAINLLEAVGRQTKNYQYLRVLSSGYACKSGYSEPVFFGTDLSNISSASLWGSLSQFTNSTKMVSPTQEEYLNLFEAIEILLYAGGGIKNTTEPTVALRGGFISGNDLNDLHAQAMYMILTALGMYVYHYGDAEGGAKAARTINPEGNNCFLDYNENITLDATLAYVKLDDAITALPASNACKSQPNSGHSDLDTVAANLDRLCEGVFLFNNLRIVLAQVLGAIGSGNDDFNALEPVETLLDLQRTIFLSVKNGLDDVDTVLSKEVCVTENTANTEPIELFFFFYFDTLFE